MTSDAGPAFGAMGSRRNDRAATYATAHWGVEPRARAWPLARALGDRGHGVLRAVAESPWVRLPLVIFLVLAVQTTVGADIRIVGVAPDLMLLLAVASGLVVGPERGAVIAFIIGLSYDLVLQTPFGLSAFAYAAAAFGAGYVKLSVLRAPRWIPILTVAVASAGGIVVFALVGTLFGLEHVLDPHLLTVIIVVSVINGALALPAIRLQRWALVQPSE
jgi:rod shape-determining protein MreD